MKNTFFLNASFSQIMAAWIIGILIGAALTSLAIGYHLDNINNQNQILEGKLLEKEGQMKILEDKVSNTKRWLIVEEIIIELELTKREFPDKESLHCEIEQQIREMVNNIRGKKVKDLDPQVLWNIIEKRNVSLKGHSFTLEVRGLLISEKLTYYVFAKFNEPKQPIENM
ncbi:hypothetical protein SAMN00017405_1000 [Desulfonispora thiosulfatigenes DSM 11270]|uniref:Sporulation membrane protein YtrI C-terminal domain-containing protein n=1 Tax=Desulfonispora thiosulfatigenes DSM 11270 TaxID=656914 RepID=A0A1W1UPV3_DESTI|nr:hypothetical protein [Desulfonispora thiosulfatigenes]SMB83090.1 hypothetical protein SAMN00017405_1000 [Desulfonispora thiosulfatigenes DSM 11270]